jgi:ribonuclease HII
MEVIGIDEAGRGPLAGPVAVGAVIFSKRARFDFDGLADSKKLSTLQREEWFRKMKDWQKEGKLRFAVSLISNTVIDTKGIASAISLGIERCFKKLNVDPNRAHVFLDGGLKAPDEFLNQQTIIKGDEKIPAISLASIAAKETRDTKMKQLAKKYPQYGFEIHKGYGTLFHRKAIKKYKASDIHRKTFLKNFPQVD